MLFSLFLGGEVSTARAVLYPVEGKGQCGVGCAAVRVPPCVLPVHMCVLLSVAVVTVERSAGGAAPEPGEGQRAREDRICFSAALVISRDCKE